MDPAPDDGHPHHGVALGDYTVAELAAAIAWLGKRGGHVHRGVHMARKSIRRTRAALRLGGRLLGPGGDLIDHALRRLNRELSPLRDLQALVQALDRLGAQSEGESTALLARARRIAIRRRADAAKAPEFGLRMQESRLMLAALQAALQGLPWAEVHPAGMQAAFAQAVLERDKAHARAVASDDPRDWHRWRRSARRVSQMHRGAEAAGEAVPMTARDKHVAEALGLLQDTSLVLEHCGKGAGFPKPLRRPLKDYASEALRRQREHLGR